MEKYNFMYDEKEYELGEDNCDFFANDEEKPVEGIVLEDVLELLRGSQKVNFNVEYYDMPCGNCRAGVEEKLKAFKFLEYHFYILTKDENYVISSISKEYENTSFNKLLKQGKVDNSYIVSVIVCINCGNYSVEIEQCEI
jgi:ribonuclease HI